LVPVTKQKAHHTIWYTAISGEDRFGRCPQTKKGRAIRYHGRYRRRNLSLSFSLFDKRTSKRHPFWFLDTRRKANQRFDISETLIASSKSTKTAVAGVHDSPGW